MCRPGRGRSPPPASPPQPARRSPQAATAVAAQRQTPCARRQSGAPSVPPCDAPQHPRSRPCSRNYSPDVVSSDLSTSSHGLQYAAPRTRGRRIRSRRTRSMSHRPLHVDCPNARLPSGIGPSREEDLRLEALVVHPGGTVSRGGHRVLDQHRHLVERFGGDRQHDDVAPFLQDARDPSDPVERQPGRHQRGFGRRSRARGLDTGRTGRRTSINVAPRTTSAAPATTTANLRRRRRPSSMTGFLRRPSGHTPVAVALALEYFRVLYSAPGGGAYLEG